MGAGNDVYFLDGEGEREECYQHDRILDRPFELPNAAEVVLEGGQVVALLPAGRGEA